MHSEPNYSLPWQMKAQTKSTASAWILAPASHRRIVTNAHAVADNTLILVRKWGCARKYTAQVLAVGHECDLAVLTVEDDDFWQGVNALELGSVPNLQEVVTVVGFPQGGDNICVTRGVVSRLDIQVRSCTSCPLGARFRGPRSHGSLCLSSCSGLLARERQAPHRPDRCRHQQASRWFIPGVPMGCPGGAWTQKERAGHREWMGGCDAAERNQCRGVSAP